MDAKTCTRCGKPYTRGADERPSAFRTRVFCSKKCAGSTAREKQLAQPGRTGVPTCNCECGERATCYVYCYQYTAEGKRSMVALEVCASCKDWILESDAGTSATPLPLEHSQTVHPGWGPPESRRMDAVTDKHRWQWVDGGVNRQTRYGQQHYPLEKCPRCGLYRLGGGKFYALTPQGDKLLKAPVCERKNNGNT